MSFLPSPQPSPDNMATPRIRIPSNWLRTLFAPIAHGVSFEVELLPVLGLDRQVPDGGGYSGCDGANRAVDHCHVDAAGMRGLQILGMAGRNRGVVLKIRAVVPARDEPEQGGPVGGHGGALVEPVLAIMHQ